MAPIGVFALLVHTWALTSVGWGNAYYAAAVRSMTMSWHNFLYASFDPGGFVAVDKPPFSLWIQALSAKIFGYSQISLLLPQAIAGTAAVVLLYFGVRTVWGRSAGALAALALALMPINVVVNHSNNTDAMLVFLMTAGAITTIKAVQTGRLRWLVLAATLAGTAMTAKMLAAVPLMPAIVAAYFWCAPRRWTIRVAHSAIAVAVMAVAGLWWFALVDLTPKDQRPYVGSSVTNSAFQLAFERNGVNQVEGTQGLGGGRGPAARGAGAGPFGRPGQGAGGPPNGPAGAGRGGFGIPRLGFNGGQPGLARLFNAELGSQIAWLIPMGLLGGLGALLGVGLRGSPKLATLIVFGGWFACGATVFSATKGIVHPYYLANIGPPIAGLVGIGAGAFRRDMARRHVRAWLLPVALLATAFAQWKLLARTDWVAWQPWVRKLAVSVLFVATIAVGVSWLMRRVLVRRVVTAASIAATLIAPGLWTQAALAGALNGPLPYAAPLGSTNVGATPAGGVRPNGGFSFLGGDQASLVAYLRANRGKSRWLVGVQSAAQAEAIIIKQAEPVMSMGGFSGSDPILDEASLRSKIKAGEIRYFLLPANGAVGGPGVPGPFGGRRVPGGRGFGAGGSGNPTVAPNLGGLLPGVPTVPGPAGVTGMAGLLPGVPAPAGNGPFTPGIAGQQPLSGPFAQRGAPTSLITQSCTSVPSSLWQQGETVAGQNSFVGGPSSASFTLYDCADLAAR